MAPGLKRHHHTPISNWPYLVALVLSVALLGCSRSTPSAATHSLAVCPIPRSDKELTALDRYVAALDTNYNFHLVRSIPGKGQTSFLLEMTSQAWLTTNEVDRPLWKHCLILVKPAGVTNSKSLLYISRGATD